MDERSEKNLKGVHPDLVKIVERAHEIAIEDGKDFIVTEGLRTVARQRELFAHGATTTMKSRHLNGHAVDLMAMVGGQGRWDWPLYEHLWGYMGQSAKELSFPLEWGGNWKKFKDGPHFQLPWKDYPLTARD